MDVCVCVCDCINGFKTSRFAIDIGRQNENTDSVFSKIATKLDANENELDVVYCGQKLQKNNSVEALNLTPQSTLFVFRKAQRPVPSTDIPSLRMASEVMPLIHKAIQQANYKKTVDKILTTKDSLQKLTNAVPGLEKDPIALSMLQDPELLQMLTSRVNIHKLLKEHPLFGAAATYIAKIVDEEYACDPTRPSANAYSLDQMSDDEDDGSQGGAVGGAAPQQQITASQVAAAVAAATASAQPSTSGTSSQQPMAGNSSATARTTSALVHDFFQQRMMTAHNSVMEAQLQQLRDMGTDENVARQALAITNGDLQAAIEWIFDGRNM